MGIWGRFKKALGGVDDGESTDTGNEAPRLPDGQPEEPPAPPELRAGVYRNAYVFHDLRHYFASLLIAQGLDVKVVQKSLRHSSAKTTLDTYGHMWPDKEETARAAVAHVLGERLASQSERGA
jgi:hypothetical protein